MRKLKRSTKSYFTSYDELPFAMNVKDVSKALDLSLAKTYQLFNSDGFPKLEIGKRLIVTKANFIDWLNNKTI